MNEYMHIQWPNNYKMKKVECCYSRWKHGRQIVQEQKLDWEMGELLFWLYSFPTSVSEPGYELEQTLKEVDMHGGVWKAFTWQIQSATVLRPEVYSAIVETGKPTSYSKTMC